jgi:hypothetical protein
MEALSQVQMHVSPRKRFLAARDGARAWWEKNGI